MENQNTIPDTSHLDALRAGLRHEEQRLAFAKTPGEIAHRRVWVSQYEKQIADEIQWLADRGYIEDDMSDDELLAALGVAS